VRPDADAAKLFPYNQARVSATPAAIRPSEERRAESNVSASLVDSWYNLGAARSGDARRGRSLAVHPCPTVRASMCIQVASCRIIDEDDDDGCL